VYKFSDRSRANLDQCHPSLQVLFEEVIKHYDCTILCGYRGMAEQNNAYHEGRSQLLYPKSKHNSNPSMAVDVCTWYEDKPHIRWNDNKTASYLAGYIKATADQLGIKIRLGADFNMNNDLTDNWFDVYHIELI